MQVERPLKTDKLLQATFTKKKFNEIYFNQFYIKLHMLEVSIGC